MSWVEQETQERKQLQVTPEREKQLDEVKNEVHPAIVREAAQGDKPFEPIRFQPVKSPGLFEAEFAKKESDLVFHFWPWGLHAADRGDQPRPPFTKDFRPQLTCALHDVFDSNKVTIKEDRDMAAIFVKVEGYGMKQFWFDLAHKVVTNLHLRLGGETS